MNPITEGVRIRMGMDFFAKGFSANELNEVYYRLSASKEDENLLMETASLAEIDAEYNPGIEMILEAITVRSFARTDKTMAALCRVLNKHLGEDNIQAQEAVIGKVKKSGLFAHVTVQIPFSDGQVLSIVFHSPDNDNRKIAASDEIIAFRWLLNKRDITQVVSPEAGAEVSLEQISKRVSQIVAKNSDRFQKRSAMVKEQKAALEAVQADVQAAQAKRDALTMDLAATEDDSEDLDFEIQNLTQRITKAKELNASLQAQIDALSQAEKAAKEEAIRKEAEGLGIEKGTIDTLMAEDPAKLEEIMQSQREKREHDAAVDERNRLVKLGQEQIPGIRLGNAEEAGRTWEFFQAGNMTQAEWDKYVADLYAGGYAEKPEPEFDAKQYEKQMIDVVHDRLIELGFSLEMPTNDAMESGREWVWSNEDIPGVAPYIKINLDEGMIWYGGLGFDGDSFKKFGLPADIPGKVDDILKGYRPVPQPEPTPEPELKPYIAFYNNKKLELWAKDLGDAKAKAVEQFKAPKKKQHMVSVHLAEAEEGDKPPQPEPAPEPEPEPAPRFQIGDKVEAHGKQYKVEAVGQYDSELGDTRYSIRPIEGGSLVTLNGKGMTPVVSPEPTPEPTPEPEPEETPEPEAVKMLNRILSGDFDDDPDAIDQALDQAAEELEEAGRLEEFDDLLNETADYYTTILEQREAA